MQIKTNKTQKNKTTKKLIKKRLIRSKYQKGGAAAAAASASANALKPYKFSPPAINTQDLFARAVEYCASMGLQDIIGLINEIYPAEQLTKFKLDASITDPFLQQIIPDADYYNRWYREKLGIPADSTEELKPMNHPSLVDTLQIPEFKTLLAQIARDCLIMLITSRRNLDNQYRQGDNKISEIFKKIRDISNKEKSSEYITNDEYNAINGDKSNLNSLIHSLQNYSDSTKTNANKVKHLSKSASETFKTILAQLILEINECIKQKFLYKKILEIIIKFIILLSLSEPLQLEEFESNYMGMYKKFISTPYIIFPSYQSINFQTVVALISAPIINFRISNRKRKVHRLFTTPMNDMLHDIQFHGMKTHKIFKKIQGINAKTYKYESQLYQYFNIINEILKLLFPYYYCTDCTQETDKKEYAQELVNYDNLIENNKKNVISLLLFTIMHEMLQITGRSEYNLNYNFKDYIYKLDTPEQKMEIIKHLKYEVSNNMFDRKYPFVSKLDWNSVVEAFIKIINELNKGDNKYDDLVDKLPEPL